MFLVKYLFLILYTRLEEVNRKKKSDLARHVRHSYSTAQATEKYVRRASEGLRRWEQAMVDRFFPDVGRALVVGCGAGREAFALESLGFRVKGIDISDTLILAARSIAAELGSQVEFEVTDGAIFSEPDDSYAIVTLWSQVLANVPTARTRKTLVSEAFRVLTSAGLMSLSVHDGASTLPRVTDDMRYKGIDPNAGLEEGDLVLKSEDGESPVFWHYFDEEEVQNLYLAAGFQDIHIFRASDLGESYDNVFCAIGKKL